MIVAGFGFRASATEESLADALAKTSLGYLPDAVATAADKARTEVFQSFAAHIGAKVLAVEGAFLASQKTLTASRASQHARKTGSVAEASALAAAGVGASLLGPRRVSQDRLATCALAKGAEQ